jgi:hypothetical protein
MPRLKHSVLHHQLDEISSIVEREGARIPAEERRAMLKLSTEMGNVMTIARVARLFADETRLEDVAPLFRKYVVAISSNYFGGGTPERAARRAWLQAVSAKHTPISRDEPDFTLSPEQRRDVRWMVDSLDLNSPEEAERFVQQAV